MLRIDSWLEPREAPARAAGRFWVQVMGVQRGQQPRVGLVDETGKTRLQPQAMEPDERGRCAAELCFPQDLHHGEKVFAMAMLYDGETPVGEPVRARRAHVIDNIPRIAIDPIHGELRGTVGRDSPRQGIPAFACPEHPVDVRVDTPGFGTRRAEWFWWKESEEHHVAHELPPPSDELAVFKFRAPIPQARPGWRVALLVTWQGEAEERRGWSKPIDILALDEVLLPPRFQELPGCVAPGEAFQGNVNAIRNTRLDGKLLRVHPPAEWELPIESAPVSGTWHGGPFYSINFEISIPIDVRHGDRLYVVLGSSDLVGNRVEVVSSTIDVDLAPRLALAPRHLDGAVVEGEKLCFAGRSLGVSPARVWLLALPRNFASPSVRMADRPPCPALSTLLPGANAGERDRSPEAARRIFCTKVTAPAEPSEPSSYDWAVLAEATVADNQGDFTGEVLVPHVVDDTRRLTVVVASHFEGVGWLAGAADSLPVRVQDKRLAEQLQISILPQWGQMAGPLMPGELARLRFEGLMAWPIHAEVTLKGEPLTLKRRPVGKLDPSTQWEFRLPPLGELTGSALLGKAVLEHLDGNPWLTLEARASIIPLVIKHVWPERKIRPGDPLNVRIQASAGLKFDMVVLAGGQYVANQSAVGSGSTEKYTLPLPTDLVEGTQLSVRCQWTAPWGSEQKAEAVGPIILA